MLKADKIVEAIIDDLESLPVKKTYYLEGNHTSITVNVDEINKLIKKYKDLHTEIVSKTMKAMK